MLPRPFHSIGLLFHRRSGANLAFLGTCFAYRSRDVFVTAAHCFGNLKAADLEIVLPVVDHAAPAAVDKVVVHSSADIALLYVPTLGSAQSAPFFSTDAVLTWGSEVQALGYPEESEHRDADRARRLCHSVHLGL